MSSLASDPVIPKTSSREERAALRHKQRNSLGAAKKQIYKPSTTKTTKKTTSTKTSTREGSQKLYQDSQQRRESLELKRQSLDAECTFTPKLSVRKATTPEQDENKTTFQTRIALDAAKRKEKHKQNQLASTPTFKPVLSKVNTKSSERGIKKRQPLYQPNAQKTRKAERDKIRQRLAEEEQAKIDSTKIKRQSYNKCKNKNEPTNVVERMALAAQKSKLLREKLLKEKEAKEKATMSFKPNITKDHHSNRNGSSVSSTSTFDRLYRGASEKRQRIEQMKKEKEQANAKTLTFRPKIRDADGTLHLSKKVLDNKKWIDQQVLEGTLKLKHKKEALPYQQVIEARELRQQKEELTFQPSITSPLTSDDEGDSGEPRRESLEVMAVELMKEEKAEVVVVVDGAVAPAV